jgi:type II secretory pathway component PulF
MHAAEKMEKNQSKEYEKMLKSIRDPLREGHHFDQSLGGIAGLFEKLRSDTQVSGHLAL